MTELTPAQLLQFQATAKQLFAEAMTLAKEIPEALQSAADGCERTIRVLNSRRRDTTEAELRGLLEETVLKHAALFERCKRVAISVATLKAALDDAASQGVAEARGAIADQAVDPHVALAEAKASVAFDPMLKHFAVGVAAFVLSELINGYTAATEGFLRHKVGSVRVGERLKRVAEAFVIDAAGAVLPPFLGTAAAVFREATDSQLQRDIDALAVDTGDRFFSLRRVQTTLELQSDHAEQMIAVSTASGTNAAYNEGRVTTFVEIALRDAPPSQGG